jgi:hypothetical protein
MGRYQSCRRLLTLLVGAPGDGLEVAHLCDNPPCANPLHLAFVSHKANMQQLGENMRQHNRGMPLLTPLERVVQRPDLFEVLQRVIQMTRAAAVQEG